MVPAGPACSGSDLGHTHTHPRGHKRRRLSGVETDSGTGCVGTGAAVMPTQLPLPGPKALPAVEPQRQSVAALAPQLAALARGSEGPALAPPRQQRRGERVG